MKNRRSLSLLCLALAAAPVLDAAEAVLRDGSRVNGQIVSLVMQPDAGPVTVVPADQLVVLTAGAPAAPAPPPPPPAPTWGQRDGGATMGGPVVTPVSTGSPVAVVTPLDPTAGGALPARSLTVDLFYEATSLKPGLSPASGEADSGEIGEVFAFRPFERKDRSKWVRLGDIRRVDHQKICLFDDAAEFALLRELIRKEDETRESIVAQIDARKAQHTHTMRYHFQGVPTLRPGTYDVWVHLPKLRRHKVFHGIRLGTSQPTRLEYHWAKHSIFGR